MLTANIITAGAEIGLKNQRPSLIARIQLMGAPPSLASDVVDNAIAMALDVLARLFRDADDAATGNDLATQINTILLAGSIIQRQIDLIAEGTKEFAHMTGNSFAKFGGA